MLRTRLAGLLVLCSSHALALPVLFSGWGAGQFGLVTTTPTVTLAGNISGGTSIQDGIVAVASGDAFKMQSGTITGAVDFADTANSNAGGGSCPSDPGGVCKVNAASVG